MGGFVYTLLGTSKDVTLGPTAIMSLLCFPVVEGQPSRAVLLTLLTGLIQTTMALLRLGERPCENLVTPCSGQWTLRDELAALSVIVFRCHLLVLRFSAGLHLFPCDKRLHLCRRSNHWLRPGQGKCRPHKFCHSNTKKQKKNQTLYIPTTSISVSVIGVKGGFYTIDSDSKRWFQFIFAN